MHWDALNSMPECPLMKPNPHNVEKAPSPVYRVAQGSLDWTLAKGSHWLKGVIQLAIQAFNHWNQRVICFYNKYEH